MSKKISGLPDADTLTGDELIPLVQNGVTKKALKSAFGGGGGVTSVTYDELMASKGSWTKGEEFDLTDFATKHFIVDGDGDQILDAIITGVTETLRLKASSADTLEPVAYSYLHPYDIIHYDYNPDNWIDDASFSDLSGTPTIITGFKGIIYFRHDTLLDNYMGYDFRNCKFRRWKTAAPDWVNVTAYVKFDVVTHSGFIYMAQKSSTGQTPSNGSAYWVQLMDLSLTEYWNYCAVTSPPIPSSAEFDDFKTFAEGSGDATYENCCRSNHFKPLKDDATNWVKSKTILMNNVIFLKDGGYFSVYENEFGSAFFGSTIGGNFYRNVIGDLSDGMRIGDNCYENIIGHKFSENIVNSNFNNNTIYSYFTGNNIANGFSNNTTASGFLNNLINNDFALNTISYYFSGNTTKIGFKNNTIQPSSCQFIDFSDATHVYADYDKTIFLRQDGTAKLSYCNNSDVIVIVNANA